MEERYKNNIGEAFPKGLQNLCLSKTVAVIGAGGCGGYILEHLSRMGAKRILVFDGDHFELSNINRQRFCDETTIGMNKAVVAQYALSFINNQIEIIAIPDYFSDAYIDIIEANNVDVIFYAADPNVDIQGLNKGLERCLVKGIPIIKAGVRVFDAMAAFIETSNLDLWFSIKRQTVQQAEEFADCDFVSNLSHYNALSANFCLELYLQYLRYPELQSCFFTYDYRTNKTNKEWF